MPPSSTRICPRHKTHDFLSKTKRVWVMLVCSFGYFFWISVWKGVPFIFLSFPKVFLLFRWFCHWFSCMFLTFLLFFIGFPCFSTRLSCMFLTFPLFSISFPCSHISHACSSCSIYSCSCCSLVFLEQNILVSAAAAIAVIFQYPSTIWLIFQFTSSPLLKESANAQWQPCSSEPVWLDRLPS